LGKLHFTLRAQSDCPVTATCSFTSVAPRLPPGMSVLACRAVVLRVECTQAIRSLRFRMQCETDVAGSPCTGERLEAQEWETASHILVVGTEDAEALTTRMSFLGLGAYDEIVKYDSNSMEIQLESIPPRQHISLHYIIAENPFPEPSETSAWCAVEMPHRYLTSV
jgi:hypothetical protein